MQSLSVFRSTANIAGIYDTLFWGLFSTRGVPLLLQTLSFFFAVSSLLFAYLSSRTRKNPFQCLASLSGILTFVCLSFLCYQPWDEVFINLRHSYNLAKTGNFSFSALQPIEGTVDFLPYFIIGVLGKLGLPIIEIGLLQGTLAGIAILFIGRKTLTDLEMDEAKAWGLPLLSLYAPLVLNSGHGFTSCLFSAVVLMALRETLFSKESFSWILWSALLPLVRIEGAWFTLCFVCLRIILSKRTSKKFQSFLLSLGLTLIPFGLLSLWRWKTFGSVVPIPITYKSCLGNLFFTGIGIKNLLGDLVLTGAFSASALILIAFWGSSQRTSNQAKAFWGTSALILCVLPYYSSGGDWFPQAWARYLLPYVLWSLLVAIGLGHQLVSKIPSPQRISLLICVGLLVFLAVLPKEGSYDRLFTIAFKQRHTLGDFRYQKTTKINYRIQYLSQVGNHFKATTENSSVIGSSEMATIPYFAEREALDFLGLTNKEIAKRELRELPKLQDPYNAEGELPYLIFKRVAPDLVESQRPDYLYTFDFILSYLNPDFPFAEYDMPLLGKMIRRWERKFANLHQPLYGGLENLLKQGYHPVVVLYQNQFSTLYFVSERAWSFHRSRLTSSGFQEELISLPSVGFPG